MMLSLAAQRWIWSGVFGVGFCLGSMAAHAAEKAAAPAGEATKKVSGRLPAHYGDVVTPEQKQKIYAIQAEFQPRIAALKEQLQKLDKEQDTKIEAVLTPEQKEKLAGLKAAAAAKRRGAKPAAAAAKPAEKAKAETPAEAGKTTRKKT